MAEDFGETIRTRRLESDGFLRRFTISYKVNHPLGDNFLLSKEGTRDKKYGYYKSGFVQTGTIPYYDIVNIIYEDLKGDGPHKKYLYRGSTVSIPIERKKDTDGGTQAWFPLWNYHVVEKQADKDSVVVANWIAADKLEDTAAETYGRWMRSNQAIPTGGTGDNKIVIVPGLEAIKPGVQAFLVPSVDVTEIIYTRNKQAPDTLTNYLDAKGKRVAPGNVFGLSAAAPDTGWSTWLCKGAQAKRINDWYEVVRTFTHMPYGWDPDLYPAGS